MPSKKEILKKTALLGLGTSFIYSTFAAYQDLQSEGHETSFSNELFNQTMNVAFKTFAGTVGSLVAANTLLEFIKDYDRSIGKAIGTVAEWIQQKANRIQEGNESRRAILTDVIVSSPSVEIPANDTTPSNNENRLKFN